MWVQMLLEPVDCSVLRPFQPLSLHRVIHVALGRESMGQAREVLVVPFDVERWKDLEGVLLQLGRKGRICLWSADLDGRANRIDLGFLKQRRVGEGDAVDEIVS